MLQPMPAAAVTAVVDREVGVVVREAAALLRAVVERVTTNVLVGVCGCLWGDSRLMDVLAAPPSLSASTSV